MPGSSRSLAAVDLGAESGRVIVGRFDGTSISLAVTSRFDSESLYLQDGRHWNLPSIFTSILRGLGQAVTDEGALDGIGIDTWGVDYALLDEHGRTLGLPYHYRDARTSADVIAATFARVPQLELYQRTGIQTMPINTIFQLMAEPRGPVLDAADRIALVPDLLGLWLTGELVNESTIASTSGLLEAGGSAWARDLIERLGLPGRPFAGQVTEPGAALGPVLATHRDQAGAAVSAPVWVVAGHDTASAFVAAPVAGPDSAILSSGTWSLVGLEVEEPQLGPEAAAFNLTNERGIDGRTRLLRNVMGLFLLQECRREWRRAGEQYEYEELQQLAANAQEGCLFDPDDEALLRGGAMPELIAAACGACGQQPPASAGELARSILVSLACKYRFVLERLQLVSGRQINAINAVGGGVRNALLCQLTADITGLPVLAGPEEATALGNVLVQARALGEVGSLAEMRELVARSSQVKRYEPRGGRRDDETYERFLALTGLRSATKGNAQAAA
jgi:rhamnulokinase